MTMLAHLTKRHRRPLAAALALVGALSLAACQEDEPSVNPTPEASRSIPLSSGEPIALKPGETVAVNVGRQNSSIGDNWNDSITPAGVATVKGHVDSDCDEPAPGCGGRLTYFVTGVKPGKAVLTVQYCFRSSGPTCAGGPDNAPHKPPTTIAITVT
ncbi:protease inhibitor I42 family protein [Luteipulveratus mongoliensis]|uniref:Proteinase inhibitor I42 chagasin domain-containing protein n=1 Tax=Luteipulveratus mongoliensis TaxID=571913 RepID=A0A0K1JDL4_9MICO|nr:protease inhibitor I42 family protein [Luteipulveratus mongoliensis]AKU14797.1 hypothetical protein VV02_01115 [Luteipulveratus mongoliensis]